MTTHPDVPDSAIGTVTRQPLVNRATLAALHSPLRRLLNGTTALRYHTVDGRAVTLPVGCVAAGSELVVLVGASSRKTWWRHFRQVEPVEIWRHGGWQPTTAQAFAVGTAEHTRAAAAYVAHHRRVDASADPVVVVALPAEAPITMAAMTDAGWWRAWTRWATAGEFAGFAVPAVTGALVGGVNGTGVAAALVAAGAAEGALLGAAQARVLERRLPAFDRPRWILATSCAAALAWAIGLIPMLTNGFQNLATVVVIPVAVLLGVILLASIGTAQWLVLRVQLPHSMVWIFSTAGAWTAGLTAFLVVAMPLWHPGQAPALIAAIGALGGLVMAFTVAALTGWAFVRVCRR